MVLDIPGGLFEQRDVRETPAGTSSSTSSTSILAPIGSILAWLKSYTNTPQALPDGWMEANGSVISDADSVFDGQNAPDLNGGEFIRGDATSGGTGGSATMAHTHTGTASGTTGNESSHTHTFSDTSSTENTIPVFPEKDAGNAMSAADSDHTHNVSGTTGSGSSHHHSFSDSFTTSAASNTENRPPYYNVVWIFRFK